MRSLPLQCGLHDSRLKVWREGFKRRQVSTEAVLLVVRQLCSEDVFKQFAESYPVVGGQTTLEDANADSIASGLEVPVK